MFDSLSLVGWPMLAGVVATISHTVLGRQVLSRGIVFIDLAIAQCAALGLLIGATLEWHGMEQSLLGIGFSMGGAALVAALCHFWPNRREAAIGMLYVTSASLAVLVASIDPHGLQRVAQLLAGDPLWVTGSTLWPLALATLPFLCLVVLRPHWLNDGWVFYPVFALMISLSLPLLGLYLVFATLILPAAIAEQRAGGMGTVVGVLLGVAGYGVGLALSLHLDWPSGASIVVAMVVLAGLFGLLSRRVATRQQAQRHEEFEPGHDRTGG